MLNIKYVNTSGYEQPVKMSSGASGYDIKANLNEPISLAPLERELVPTGLFLEIPSGYEAQIRARSGLAIKSGLGLLNGIGTVDSDYRGEIKVILVNLSKEEAIIHPGDRIAQLIFSKVVDVKLEEVKPDELSHSRRGNGGFGHTGI